MRTFRHKAIGRLAAAASVAVWTMAAAANGASDAQVIEISRGTVSFEVGTNVPALRVHGKSGALAARARFGAGPEGIVLEQIDARVPVKSLETGLGLRDDHMRKYIFTTADGQMPDVRFSGDRAECLTTGRRTTCTVNGTLVIRDTSKPFTMLLTINEDKDVLRALGEGIVRLSSYGIDQPSQLGVRTTDEVRLKLDLTARRPVTVVAAGRRDGR
jgi:polyisoprenoid-binding protein YceI